MDCRVCMATGDMWLRMGGGGGGLSHESEHDLAVMVSDFLENGSSGADSRCSSDSDSGLCDLAHLADKISYYKRSVDQYESDLISAVNSLMLSINESDLHLGTSGPCNASCIRFILAKLLRLSGYDAAVCSSKWQGTSKVPGGDHEYIDVIKYNTTTVGGSERVIIDIDFRSHFEIARAVQSYDRILKMLPVVYVGSLTKLRQFLQVMAEAGRSSLKQNSMPLPPWRSFAYLQAKWQSPYQRKFNSDEQEQEQEVDTISSEQKHKQCSGHLKRLQALLQLEIEVLKPIQSCDNNSVASRRMKIDRWRLLSFRTL